MLYADRRVVVYMKGLTVCKHSIVKRLFYNFGATLRDCFIILVQLSCLVMFGNSLFVYKLT